MATQKETIEKLLNKEEILYWSRKNNIQIEEFDGGIYIDEWTVLLDQEDKIAAVERRLDVPREL
ncbi:hypothetical protein SEA_TUNATARTARE_4 [Streptomyces phage TunaTartare]|uniref:Uncharacterized protein n=1 Tax=Streptomyces phage TunaTartare TaxID=2848887 RepID=A0A8F2E7N9_9CAUD|nr:hypothetical protein PP457_gp004 [Streptomyces phage TunaTartare]QWT29900.1 hypothetical protein SEA_TUNATARTARE_4 [Streptomyces phage TunaTartare]